MAEESSPLAMELFMDYAAMDSKPVGSGANVNYAGLVPLAWSIGGG